MGVVMLFSFAPDVWEEGSPLHVVMIQTVCWHNAVTRRVV
jgi:hypothetical protein